MVVPAVITVLPVVVAFIIAVRVSPVPASFLRFLLHPLIVLTIPDSFIYSDNGIQRIKTLRTGTGDIQNQSAHKGKSHLFPQAGFDSAPGATCAKQAESSSNAHPGIPKKLTK